MEERHAKISFQGRVSLTDFADLYRSADEVGEMIHGPTGKDKLLGVDGYGYGFAEYNYSRAWRS